MGVRYPTVNGYLIAISILVTVEMLLTFKHVTLKIKYSILYIKYSLRHEFESLSSGKWVNGSGRLSEGEESDTVRLAHVRGKPSSGRGKERKHAGILC